MRKPIIAANWKMFKTGAESRQFLDELASLMGDATDADVVICPPFTALSAAAGATNRIAGLSLGAQDVHWEIEGAFTGEVSARMLAEFGVTFVIVGHSERRQFCGELDQTVNRKANRLINEGFQPIVCVGETLDHREAGKTQEVVERQLRAGLEGIDIEGMRRITVAYEPCWAIGTGIASTPDDAEEVIVFIRRVLAELASREVAAATRIQYGGSVKPDNIGDFLSRPDIDGALVGGASLEAGSFYRIVKNSIEAKAKAHSI
ncbi:MAG: triose-phosphate isomerase [Terriglobia bacterium]